MPKLPNWKRTGYREWTNIFNDKLKVKTVKRNVYIMEFKGVPVREHPYPRITEALNDAVNFMRKWNEKVVY